MKTVKEFKDAGIVFVEGDECINNDSEYLYAGCHWPKLASGNPHWNDYTVTKFAWRTNTGEQPSFKGVVEVEFRSGRASRARISGFGWWLDGDDTDIIKWRPVIGGESKMEGKTNNPRVSERKDIPECKPEIKITSNTSDCDVTIGKPESEGFCSRSAMAEFKPSKQGPIPGDRQRFNGKEFVLTNIEVRGQAWTPIENLKQEPVFTKEMHEAGELPPVGSKFMLAKKINCQRLDQFQGVECTVIGHCKSLEGDDVITFSETNRGYACMLHFPECIKPIKQGPIPGDRQRFNGKEFVLTNIEVRGQAWTPIENLKQEPVFTKEMHEAGELPPVGSECYAIFARFSGGREHRVTVVHVNGSQVACIDDDGNYLIQYTDDGDTFKPIDTRTEEEKLIDEIMEFIDVEADDHIKPKSLIYRMIKAGYRKP